MNESGALGDEQIIFGGGSRVCLGLRLKVHIDGWR